MKDLKIAEQDKKAAQRHAAKYGSLAPKEEFKGNLRNIDPELFVEAIRACIQDGVGITFCATKDKETLCINFLVNKSVEKNYFKSEGDVAKFLYRLTDEKYLLRADAMRSQCDLDRFTYTVGLIRGEQSSV